MTTLGWISSVGDFSPNKTVESEKLGQFSVESLMAVVGWFFIVGK